jgi:predicted nucleotidyltransferase
MVNWKRLRLQLDDLKVVSWMEMLRITPEEVLLWHLLEKQAEQVNHLLGAQYTKEILKMDLKMVLRRKKKGGINPKREKNLEKVSIAIATEIHGDLKLVGWKG